MKQIPYGAIKTIAHSRWPRWCDCCGFGPPVDQVIITLHEPDAKGRFRHVLEGLVEHDDFVALVRSSVYRHYDDFIGGGSGGSRVGGADEKKEVV